MTLRKAVAVTLICLAVAVGLVWAARRQQPRPGQPVVLMAHAGAGIRPALDELGEVFARQTGIKAEYNYKGSGCLLPDLLASRKGDVYPPGELYYVQQAIDRGLVRSFRTVANLTTVLIVQAGNPKHIRGVRDLARPGLRLGIGDPEVVAVGRAAREVMQKAGIWEKAKNQIAMAGQNVSEVSNAVKLGHIDAAIVWDAAAALYTSQELTTIPIPESLRVVSPVSAGVVSYSRHPEAAAIFRKHGFSVPVPPEQRRLVVKGKQA